MDTSNGIDTLVEQVNALLQTGEPANISIDEHTGNVGYKPQAVVDAMNKVFKHGMWGFREITNDLADGKDKDGVIKPILAIAKVEVWLKGVDFQPTAWGQARITKGDMGDARKGAQTDAIKKGLSYFSVGNRAYLGLLKEVVKNPSSQVRSNGGVANPPARPTSAPKPATPEPSSLDAIPTPGQLKKAVEDGKYTANGKVLDWPAFLALAFSNKIKSGGITVKQLVEAGSELPPKYCQHAAMFLRKLQESKAA